MALSGSTVWEVRNGGNDNNGGGFVEGASGTDFSQQDAAQDSGTNLTIDGTTDTDVTPDGYTVSSADVGNIIQITAGTGFTTGFYEIVSIQDGTKWRLDRSPAAVSTSGGTWSLGGALASPGKAVGAMVNSNTIFIKYHASPYLITSTTLGVSNGIVKHGDFASTRQIIGYDTTRTRTNTDANWPTIKASGISSIALIGSEGSSTGLHKFRNLIADGDNLSNITGFSIAGNTQRGCNSELKAINCTTGFVAGSQVNLVKCCAEDCTTGFSTCDKIACVAKNCTTGFTNNGNCNQCIAINCSSDGFVGGSSAMFSNCIAYGCGDGFDMSAGGDGAYGCIAYNNSGNGFNLGSTIIYLINCAAGDNTSGNTDLTLIYELPTLINLTADPFVDAANDDFNINNAAGGGALLRAASFEMPA